MIKINYKKVLLALVLLLTLSLLFYFLLSRLVENQVDKRLANLKTQVENVDQEDLENTAGEEVDTSNWETYRNEEYGFEVKYPSSYSLLEDQGMSNSSKIFSAVLKSPNPLSGGGFPQPHIEFVVYENDAEDLESWLLKHTTDLPFDDPSVSMANSPFYYRGITEEMETTLNGKEAYTFQSRMFESSPKPILTELDGYIFGLVFDNENESKDPELKKLYPEILSTFEFMSEDVFLSKECASSVLDVSLKIPQDWSCESTEFTNQGTLDIKSDEFSITISNVGGGGPCEGTSSPEECVSEEFLNNDSLALEYFFRTDVDSYSIFGRIENSKNPTVWIRPVDSTIERLSAKQENLLKEVFLTFN